jgi:hypothetical protein
MLDENGIWWFDITEPECDLDMTVTSADTKGVALLHTIQSLTEESIVVTVTNGRVTIALVDMPESLDEAGHIVVKQIDEYTQKRGPVVSSLRVGAGLSGGSANVEEDGSLVGDVSLQLAQYNNLRIPAQITNLNNAITSVESPHVFILFPDSRTSITTLSVQLPDLGTAKYSAKIFAEFLNPGASQTPPAIEATLVATPSTDGVTPDTPVATTFPDFPSTITAGDFYLVESDASFDLDGYSQGHVIFSLTGDTPSPGYKMVSVGVRLILEEA